MPKIRDLGINVLPATWLREAGDWDDFGMWLCGDSCHPQASQCPGQSNCAASNCAASNCQQATRPPKSEVDGVLTHAAVAQMKQQLLDCIGAREQL